MFVPLLGLRSLCILVGLKNVLLWAFVLELLKGIIISPTLRPQQQQYPPLVVDPTFW